MGYLSSSTGSFSGADNGQSFGNSLHCNCGTINSGGNNNSNSEGAVFDGVACAVFAITSNIVAVVLTNKLCLDIFIGVLPLYYWSLHEKTTGDWVTCRRLQQARFQAQLECNHLEIRGNSFAALLIPAEIVTLTVAL